MALHQYGPIENVLTSFIMFILSSSCHMSGYICVQIFVLLFLLSFTLCVCFNVFAYIISALSAHFQLFLLFSVCRFYKQLISNVHRGHCCCYFFTIWMDGLSWKKNDFLHCFLCKTNWNNTIFGIRLYDSSKMIKITDFLKRIC